MKKISLCIAGLFAALCLNAQEADPGQGSASMVMPFSLIARNATALSMGGTSAAYDVAKIFSSYTLDANAGYQKWAPSLVTGSGNLVVDARGKFADKIGIVFSLASDSGSSYTISDGNSLSKDTFTPKDLSLKLGASYVVTDFLALGANFKYFSSKLSPSDNISSSAADVYVAGNFSGFTTSAGLSNVGQGVNGFKLPSSVFLTAGYAASVGESSSIRAALQTDLFFYNAVSAGAGIEFGVKDTAFLRAGYHFASETAVLPSFMSVGAGFKFSGVKLDAAFLLASEALGNTFQLSLGYEF